MPPKKDDDKGEEFVPTFSMEEKGVPEERIYWARASGLSIANWRTELREGNAIVRPEASLKFNDHIKITGDPEMIEFIEKSNAFRDSRVKRVNTLKEAYALTAQVRQLRRIREISSSSDEKSPTIGRR